MHATANSPKPQFRLRFGVGMEGVFDEIAALIRRGLRAVGPIQSSSPAGAE